MLLSGNNNGGSKFFSNDGGYVHNTFHWFFEPAWSPDGRQIAYLQETNQALILWIVNLTRNARSGAYSVQGSPVQATNGSGGLDGDSRIVWTS